MQPCRVLTPLSAGACLAHLLLWVILVLPSEHVFAQAAQCPDPGTGCPSISSSGIPLAPNAHVIIQVIGSPTSAQMTDLQNAVNTANGTAIAVANNNTFTLSTTVTSAFTINFNTTVTAPDEIGGGLNTSNSSGYLTSNNILIFLGALNCGPRGTYLQCFNSSAAGYDNAIQAVATHEFLHMLGYPDVNANMGTIMGAFNGTNTVNNSATTPNKCDNTAASIMRAWQSQGNICAAH